MNPSAGLFIALPIVTIIAYGLVGIFKPGGENQCQMTYMFETPEYLKIPLDSKMQTEYPDYGLYIYGEGQQAARLKASKFKTSGVPMLFLPGNAGGFRQVRSQASVALRMAYDEPAANHFDWFTIDYNEEMGGIHGSTLTAQSHFTARCVRHILSLYKHIPVSSRPSSVLVLAHSMGGVVARALFTTALLPENSVHTIITLASPHQMPALPLDGRLDAFYSTVQQHWQNTSTQSRAQLSNVVTVSLSGGLRDELIPAVYTPVSGLAGSNNTCLSKVMSAVPHVWVTTDHLAILWCRQLVVTLSRMLFEMVDGKTKQITSDASDRMAVISQHLNSHSPLLASQTSEDDLLDVVLVTKPVWQHSDKSKSKVFIFSTDEHRELSVVTNVHRNARLVQCMHSAASSRCSNPIPLPRDAIVSQRILPPLYSATQVVRVDLGKVEHSHVALVMPRHSKTKAGNKVFAACQVSNVTAPEQVTVPSYADVASFSLEEPRLTHQLSMLGFTELWQAFTVSARPLACTVASPAKHMSVVLSTRVNDYAQELPQHSVVDLAEKDAIVHEMSLQSLVSDSEPVQLEIASQYPCSWQVSVKLNIHHSIVQFVRSYLTSSLRFLTLAMLTISAPAYGLVLASTLSILSRFYSVDVNVFHLSEHVLSGPVWLLPAMFMVCWALLAVMATVQILFVSTFRRCLCCRTSLVPRSSLQKALALLFLVLSLVAPLFSCAAVSRYVLYAVVFCHMVLSSSKPQQLGMLFFVGCAALLHGPELVFWLKACKQSGRLVVLHCAPAEWTKVAATSLLLHAGLVSPYVSAKLFHAGEEDSFVLQHITRLCLIALL